jgi:hypothetical protein
VAFSRPAAVPGTLIIQRQPASATPPTVTPPTPRALWLYQIFTAAPHTSGESQDKWAFTGFNGAGYDSERKRPGAEVVTLDVMKGAILWRYEFAVVNTGPRTEMFVREQQDGTQIVNFYQRGLTGIGDSFAARSFSAQNGAFVEGSGEFAFTSPEFAKFYADLDATFAAIDEIPFVPQPPEPPGLRLASHTRFTIQFAGEKNAVNEARARTIRTDLVARGAKAMNVSVVFGAKGNDGPISIKFEPGLIQK